MKISKLMGLNFLDEQTCNLIEEFESFKDHRELRERLEKTFYYGKLPSTARPSLPLTEVTVDVFSKSVPKVHLDILDVQYAASISKKTSLSPCSMMLALMYLERLRHKNPQYLQTVSSCDLFLVSMMVASKYLCDDVDEGGVFNDEWAETSAIDLKDLNNLEKEFLSAMDWELFVKPTEFFDFMGNVESRLAKYQGAKRNWLTYTEVCILVRRLCSMSLLLEDLTKVIIVCGIAYVSAVLTLLAATTLALKLCALVPSAAVSRHQLSHFPPTWPIITEAGLSSSANCSSLLSLSAITCDYCTLPEVHRDIEAPTTVQHSPSHRHGEQAVVVSGLDRWQQAPAVVWDVFKHWPTCCGANSMFL